MPADSRRVGGGLSPTRAGRCVLPASPEHERRLDEQVMSAGAPRALSQPSPHTGFTRAGLTSRGLAGPTAAWGWESGSCHVPPSRPRTRLPGLGGKQAAPWLQ